MVGKKKFSVTQPRPKSTPTRLRIPFVTLLRMFLIGSVAVIASGYAIWRHYTVPRAPMLQPVPSSSEIEIDPNPPP